MIALKAEFGMNVFEQEPALAPYSLVNVTRQTPLMLAMGVKTVRHPQGLTYLADGALEDEKRTNKNQIDLKKSFNVQPVPQWNWDYVMPDAVDEEDMLKAGKKVSSFVVRKDLFNADGSNKVFCLRIIPSSVTTPTVAANWKEITDQPGNIFLPGMPKADVRLRATYNAYYFAFKSLMTLYQNTWGPRVELHNEVDTILNTSADVAIYGGSVGDGRSPNHYHQWKIKIQAAAFLGAHNGCNSVRPTKTSACFSWIRFGYFLALKAAGYEMSEINWHGYGDMFRNTSITTNLIAYILAMLPGYDMIITETNDRPEVINGVQVMNTVRQKALWDKITTWCNEQDRVKQVLFFELFDSPLKDDKAYGAYYVDSNNNPIIKPIGQYFIDINEKAKVLTRKGLPLIWVSKSTGQRFYITTKKEETPTAPVTANGYQIKEGLPAGYVTNGTVDYRAAIQTVLDTYLEVVFPPFPVLIDVLSNGDGLKFRNGHKVWFVQGSQVWVKPNGLESYDALMFRNISGCDVHFAYVVGDLDNHIKQPVGVEDEHGMGISVVGCNNMFFESPTALKCWGDGIYQGVSTAVKVPTNNKYTNVTCMNNGRNGMSIVSGKDLLVDRGYFAFNNRTLPKNGIDLEPNQSTDEFENCVFNDCTFEGHNEHAFQINFKKLYGSGLGKKIDVTVNNPVFLSNKNGLKLSVYTDLAVNGEHIDGFIRFNNAYFKNDLVRAVYATMYDDSFKAIFYKPTVERAGVKFTPAQFLTELSASGGMNTAAKREIIY